MVLNVMMEIGQHVQMELYLVNLHALMEIYQPVQMDQLHEDLVEDFVMTEVNLSVLMATALYVLMEQKNHLVQIVASQSA